MVRYVTEEGGAGERCQDERWLGVGGRLGEGHAVAHLEIRSRTCDFVVSTTHHSNASGSRVRENLQAIEGG
jgi:hypothetical protein